ncbi:MAG: OmpA family protein, partial [Alphaproteobacteria bacterium]|nr:OmpA family protein [Alphaproteobacteria bacterium]
FVIQSGVLFPSGSAEISEEGRENLRQIADFIRELVSEIPDDVDWILRVDGHTDSKPIQTIRFPSNWELSTARATSVVRFMISLGVPEHRLMAAGLGEFQPLADGEDADTMQRNRRIEFKLTDR